MHQFFDLTPESLGEYAEEHGLPRFVGAQMLEWVYLKGVIDPHQMTNISLRNREIIRSTMRFYTGRVIRYQIATDATQKLLIDWSLSPSEFTTERAEHADDQLNESSSASSASSAVNRTLPLPLMPPNDLGDPNRQTECVMIPAPPQPPHTRRTACISSQIGCPVGCKFCASGIGGLDGNLRAGQIVEQVHRLGQLGLEARGSGPEAPQATTLRPQVSSRITNIVFMGMGEPLANFANVTNAIRTINAPWGFGISARKITISTVGLPAAIRKLVEFEIPVTLALSLHAPNDEIRRQLIPWANYATIDELLDACDEYFQKTGREITLEYLLLRGVNDRIEHARELAALAKRLRANVNLIRYNEVKGLPFDRPTTQDVLAFQEVLRRNRVNAHVRASRGRDIAAACGQLRHEHRESKPTAA